MSVTLARNQRLVKDLETWIREATTEAAITTKGVVPDDPDYFDYIKKHDQSEKRNRQDHDKWEKDQEEDSVDLSPYKNGLAPQERLIRIAYPAGVEYGREDGCWLSKLSEGEEVGDQSFEQRQEGGSKTALPDMPRLFCCETCQVCGETAGRSEAPPRSHG